MSNKSILSLSLSLSLVLIACGASAAERASLKPAAATPASTDAGPEADIATVTRLAMAVAVEEYRKKLRELKQSNAKPSINLAEPIPLASTVVSTPARPMPVAPPVQEAPQIGSITGTPNALTATLSNGRLIKKGDVLELTGVRWTVSAIHAGGVAFERCEGRQCHPVSIPVASRI